MKQITIVLALLMFFGLPNFAQNNNNSNNNSNNNNSNNTTTTTTTTDNHQNTTGQGHINHGNGNGYGHYESTGNGYIQSNGNSFYQQNDWVKIKNPKTGIQFMIPRSHASFDSLGQTMYFTQNYEGVDLQFSIIDSIPFNDDSIPTNLYQSIAQVSQIALNGVLESFTDAQLYKHNGVQLQAKEIGVSFLIGDDRNFLFTQIYFLEDKILSVSARAEEGSLSNLLIAKKFFLNSLKLK